MTDDADEQLAELAKAERDKVDPPEPDDRDLPADIPTGDPTEEPSE